MAVRYAEVVDNTVRYIGEAPFLPEMKGVLIVNITGVECAIGWRYTPATNTFAPPNDAPDEGPTPAYSEASFQMTMQSNAVLSGFPQPALPGSGYTITFTGGRVSIQGKEYAIATKALTFSSHVDHVVYVNPTGGLATRPLTTKPLPTADELILFQVFISDAVDPTRPYSIADRRTWLDTGVRGALPLLDMVKAARITTGAYAGAFRMNRVGDINWYFANLGLYPFVEDIPTEVQAHLDLQISLFYGAGGTASTDWATLHGTTWNNQFRWPYDVVSVGKTDATDFYSGTVTKRRADSHDSYAATFLRLAVRYALTASGGLTWWDSNYAAIKESFYNNILLRQLPAPNGGAPAGYLTQTFQDLAIYPFCLTMDNLEVYRGLKDAFALMTSRGGTQATDAASFAGYLTNLENGIKWLWNMGANDKGATEWLARGFDSVAGAPLVNNHTAWYPDLVIYPMVGLYGAPLHADPDLNRQRLTKGLEWIATKAPAWWLTRNYDASPWVQNLAGMAKLGAIDIAEDGYQFIQLHHARTFDLLYIHDMGWLRYVQRLLAGESLG